MSVLTKTHMAEYLQDQLQLNKNLAKQLVESMFDHISSAIEEGEPVKLSGFGTLDTRNKKERPGRNPKTGEEVLIGPRRVAIFKPGQKLRKKVEQLIEMDDNSWK